MKIIPLTSDYEMKSFNYGNAELNGFRISCTMFFDMMQLDF